MKMGEYGNRWQSLGRKEAARKREEQVLNGDEGILRKGEKKRADVEGLFHLEMKAQTGE